MFLTRSQPSKNELQMHPALISHKNYKYNCRNASLHWESYSES